VSDADETQRDRAAAVMLATISLATSLLINAGVVCSNDGSQYALIRAFVDDGTAVIDDYVEYTFEVDYAQIGDHFYSDRPPGVAFMAAPIYAVAKGLGVSDVGRQSAVAFLASLFGALSVVLTFFLARRLGAARFGAILAALTLALATPHRSYSAALFSHAISSGLLIAAVHLALPSTWTDHRARAQLLAGVIGGYACGVDYTNGLPVAVLCIAAAILEGERSPGPSTKIAALYLAGGLVGALPTLVYHTVVFGAPWAIPYHFDVNFEYAHTVGGMYGGSFFSGLYALTLSPESGMLFYSPVLIVALAALPRFYRDVGPRALLVLLPWLALFLITCKNLTPSGGASRDVRYLMSVLPLVVLPAAWAFDWARARGRAALWGASTLLVISAIVQAVKHHALWVRDGEAWIAHIGRSEDLAATLLGFARWAAPHPLLALAVLLAGLYAARRLWTSTASRPGPAL
jgi:hypothetical protein